MGSHYFEKNPGKDSEERKIECRLRGRRMSFISDHGVFSKKEVDFGSRTLLDAYSWPEQEGSILDVGCGYGPIGISLALETERQVWLTDVNERALQLAEKNAAAYGLKNTVVKNSDLFSAIEKTDFAAIITNPPIRAGKQVVHSLFEEASNHLQSGGSLWVVIQKKQGAPSAKEKLLSIFREVQLVSKNKGYYIFCAKKD
ncbi:class I SAM-dependent methyltransferase [Salibacterium salarium]|uniref:Class I SAM-dependent methyltransferase n=1 Tax=Salibacterium salarium TaxID=284579 RepID=A0A3R9NZR5_9BACI|nr:class I SAM-dependent methyltransferase [Salibacterium salarium]RSL29732.1 class I SAM-dependent methyltransferase [Salibacterium salarium]